MHTWVARQDWVVAKKDKLVLCINHVPTKKEFFVCYILMVFGFILTVLPISLRKEILQMPLASLFQINNQEECSLLFLIKRKST